MECAQNSRKNRQALAEIPEANLVEALLNTKFRCIEANIFGKESSPSAVIRMLEAAAFNIIAIMNARRRDEVCGRTIGLYDGSLTCIEEELDLYECLFYVEKTDKAYVPFYVNEMSCEAIQILEQISRVTWSNGKSTGEELPPVDLKLFAMPNLTRRPSPIVWFEYGDAKLFSHHVFGDASIERQPKAHMFRRGYALVFHYRYENATLLSLSQQLRHRDLGMTAHYILEPGSREMVDRAEMHWPIAKESIVATRTAHAKDLAEELEEVSKEKLKEVVAKILSEAETYSGGFARLLTRFHQRLGRNIEYRHLSLSEQSSKLAEMLIDRGHRPIAFKHGDCNAGPPKPAAKCLAKGEGRLARETASPMVCHKCPYHRSSAIHLAEMRKDADRIRSQQRHGLRLTVQDRAARKELENLERVILIYSERLAR